MENYDIVIDDGKILIKEYTLTKSLSLTDFAKQLVQVEKEVETPMLPNNCIKFKSNGKINEYFIHIPMGSYQVQYASKRWLITCPHQIMYFKFKSSIASNTALETVRLIWNYSKELDFTKREFQRAAMHNVYNDGKFCMGHIDIGQTQFDTVNNWIKAYFENAFNNDLSSGKRTIDVVSKEQEGLYDSLKTPAENDVVLSKLWTKGTALTFTEKFYLKDILPRSN